MEEDNIEIPLIYPLVSLTLKTTSIVDGRAILSECEEIINFDDLITLPTFRLLNEFAEYVEKVNQAASSQQGRDALQNILDTQPPGQQTLEGDLPLKQGSQGELALGTPPVDPMAAPPDKDSL